MDFTQSLTQKLSDRHLLRHPFYEAWVCGKLSSPQLQHYALEYDSFVRAFPCFVSATHSLCEDLDARKYLVENLAEEEGFPKQTSHPELWRQFAEGLGVSRKSFSERKPGPKAQDLTQTFFELCRSSYVEGLAALYAYEYQIPEIAKVKIEGLKKHFGIAEEKTLAFFQVHEKADEWHSQATAKLLNQLSPSEQARATAAAQRATEALWDFLTEVNDESKKLSAEN